MENYVINPQVFYWINVLSILQTLLAVIGGLFAAGFICLVMACIWDSIDVKRGYKSDEICRKVCKKWAVVTGIIGFVLITASIFIPGKTTSIEMLIAKTATFDNVNWTVQQVKDVVDYIVHAINGV